MSLLAGHRLVCQASRSSLILKVRCKLLGSKNSISVPLLAGVPGLLCYTCPWPPGPSDPNRQPSYVAGSCVALDLATGRCRLSGLTGMGIYDAMKLCKADVSTICFGLAASMGAFLLASGSKGKRFCMPNSRVMIHQPLGGAGGTATEIGLQIREMMYHKIKLTKIMSRLTGKPEEQIENDTDRDYFMNAWEAVEYGLVDYVIDDGKPGLVAPIGEAKPPPKSHVWDYWTVKDRKDRKHLPSEKYIMKDGVEEEGAEKSTEEKDSNQVGEEAAAV